VPSARSSLCADRGKGILTDINGLNPKVARWLYVEYSCIADNFDARSRTCVVFLKIERLCSVSPVSTCHVDVFLMICAECHCTPNLADQTVFFFGSWVLWELGQGRAEMAYLSFTVLGPQSGHEGRGRGGWLGPGA